MHITDKTQEIVDKNGFTIQRMHMGANSKAIIWSVPKKCGFIPNTELYKLIVLGIEYINRTTEEDLNETIVSSINTYLDSEEYKNEKPYVKHIGEEK